MTTSLSTAVKKVCITMSVIVIFTLKAFNNEFAHM